MKQFSKIFIYIQLHTLRPYRGIDNLDKPTISAGIPGDTNRDCRFVEIVDGGGVAVAIMSKSKRLRIVPGLQGTGPDFSTRVIRTMAKL